MARKKDVKVKVSVFMHKKKSNKKHKNALQGFLYKRVGLAEELPPVGLEVKGAGVTVLGVG